MLILDACWINVRTADAQRSLFSSKSQTLGGGQTIWADFVAFRVMSLAQPPEVGSAAETAAAARAGHRSTLPLAAERDSLSSEESLFMKHN